MIPALLYCHQQSPFQAVSVVLSPFQALVVVLLPHIQPRDRIPPTRSARERCTRHLREARLTMTSNRPHFSTALSTAFLTSASLLTSHLIPSASLEGYWLRTYSAAFETLASLMSVRRIRAPSAANWREVSRPIPLGGLADAKVWQVDYKDKDWEIRWAS
jgi:hypothetical protein